MSGLNYKTVFIIGLGQIGGSIGLDLVADNLASEVIGYDTDMTAMELAVAGHAVNRCVGAIEEGVSEADLIILCSPIREIIRMAPHICRLADGQKTVMDVASSKGMILKALHEAGEIDNFVGGHPLTGTERIGINGAQPGMFRDRVFVLTPFPTTQQTHRHSAAEFVNALGAVPVTMSAEEHDRGVAVTSHLPHVLALSLANLVARRSERDVQIEALVGGSFRSATRVAASSQQLVLEMLLSNGVNITSAIEEMIGELDALKRLIAEKDEVGLHSLVKKAQDIADRYGHQ